MDKKNIMFCLCVLCLLFIFFNSSQISSVSNARSREVMNYILSILSKTRTGQRLLTNASVSDLNLLIRKIAHAFEFFILTLILCYTLCCFKVENFNRWIYSLFIVLLIATLDEFFQLFIQDRTSSVKDVLIDFTGGIIANILFSIFNS